MDVVTSGSEKNKHFYLRRLKRHFLSTFIIFAKLSSQYLSLFGEKSSKFAQEAIKLSRKNLRKNDV